MTTDSITPVACRFPTGATPSWEVACFFPSQGNWTDAEYLRLESVCGDAVRAELSNGCLEVLPMPTQSHHLIILFVLKALEAFCPSNAPGRVLFSGIRVKLNTGKFRQPDLVYMKQEHLHRCLEEYWEGADLVMEVVSGDPKDRERDLDIKPDEYAASGIDEYWIIDPEKESIRVLTLNGETFEVHGEFGRGEQATGKLLTGFMIDVDAVLDAGKKAK